MGSNTTRLLVSPVDLGQQGIEREKERTYRTSNSKGQWSARLIAVSLEPAEGDLRLEVFGANRATSRDLNVFPLQILIGALPSKSDRAWSYSAHKSKQPAEVLLMGDVRSWRYPHIVLDQVRQVVFCEVVLACSLR